MKKIIFAMVAVCLLSTASFAGGNKKAKKVKKAKTEQKCPTQCPRTGSCGMMK